MDSPFFFPYKHITSLKKGPFARTKRELELLVAGQLLRMFVLNYWFREFLLSSFANHFELSCEAKQLMLFYYKIYPCCFFSYQGSDKIPIVPVLYVFQYYQYFQTSQLLWRTRCCKYRSKISVQVRKNCPTKLTTYLTVFLK